MLKINLENKIIEANADMFIIPNCHGVYSQMFKSSFTEKYIKKQKNLAEENGFEFSTEDRPIELWFVSEEDFGCENMQDHWSHIEINGERYTFRLEYNTLPLVMLKDIKEGKSIDVKFPITLTKSYKRGEEIPEEEETIDMQLLLHLTANQLAYRYRRFGNFEEVITNVA